MLFDSLTSPAPKCIVTWGVLSMQFSGCASEVKAKARIDMISINFLTAPLFLLKLRETGNMSEPHLPARTIQLPAKKAIHPLKILFYPI
jgi:hypothetical protein